MGLNLDLFYFVFLKNTGFVIFNQLIVIWKLWNICATVVWILYIIYSTQKEEVWIWRAKHLNSCRIQF